MEGNVIIFFFFFFFYLRQTIVFSDYLTPEINALFNKQMNNVYGKIKIRQHHKGTILDVNMTNIRQVQVTEFTLKKLM